MFNHALALLAIIISICYQTLTFVFLRFVSYQDVDPNLKPMSDPAVAAIMAGGA
jgi:hypothetical protein